MDGMFRAERKLSITKPCKLSQRPLLWAYYRRGGYDIRSISNNYHIFNQSRARSQGLRLLPGFLSQLLSSPKSSSKPFQCLSSVYEGWLFLRQLKLS